MLLFTTPTGYDMRAFVTMASRVAASAIDAILASPLALRSLAHVATTQAQACLTSPWAPRRKVLSFANWRTPTRRAPRSGVFDNHTLIYQQRRSHTRYANCPTCSSAAVTVYSLPNARRGAQLRPAGPRRPCVSRCVTVRSPRGVFSLVPGRAVELLGGGASSIYTITVNAPADGFDGRLSPAPLVARVHNACAIAPELRQILRDTPIENALYLVWSLTRGSLVNALSYNAALVPSPRLAASLDHFLQGKNCCSDGI